MAESRKSNNPTMFNCGAVLCVFCFALAGQKSRYAASVGAVSKAGIRSTNTAHGASVGVIAAKGASETPAEGGDPANSLVIRAQLQTGKVRIRAIRTVFKQLTVDFLRSASDFVNRFDRGLPLIVIKGDRYGRHTECQCSTDGGCQNLRQLRLLSYAT